MGQNQEQNNSNKKVLTINEQLTNIINEKIRPDKKRSKKGTKYIRFTYKKKITKKLFANEGISNNDDDIDEEENELNLKDVADLVDLIYTKNINTQLKHRANKSVYETVFDIRNIMDFNEDLKNNEYNKKSSQIMKDIIEPEYIPKNNKNRESETSKNINNNENIDEDNNIDEYYIEKDFFRKWDYHDDIFVNDIEENLENIEEDKDNEDNTNENKENENINNKKEDNEVKINNNVNNNYGNGQKDKKYIDEFNNKDNNSTTEYFEIIENKDSNLINNFKDKKNDINQSEIINNNINGSKYYKDSDDSDKFEIGNKETIKLNNSNNSENSNDSSINYNIKEKDSNDEIEIENENQNENEKLKYKIINKNNNVNSNKNNNNININNNIMKEVYTKKKIQNSLKSNINNKNKLQTVIIKNDNYNINVNNKNHNNDNNDNDNNEDDNNENYRDSFNIDDYYTNSIHRTKSPIISRIRNRRVDYRKIIANKGINTDDMDQNQLYFNNVGNTPNKKYISKTPEKDIIPKTYKKEIVNNNNKNIKNINIVDNLNKNKTSLIPQNYKKYKLNYDIKDINETIKRVEEQIKSIEKYDKKYNNIKNAIENNNTNKINIKKVNNNFTVKVDKKIPYSVYKENNKKSKKIYETKSVDNNNLRGYKEIMPKINNERKERENNKMVYNENFRAKTPYITIKKNKIKRKKKKNNNNNMNNNKNETRDNRFIFGGESKNKNKIDDLRSGFYLRKAWK